MNGQLLDEAQGNAEAEREAKGIPNLSPEQEAEIGEVIRPLFQQSYKVMYEEGIFDALIAEIESGMPVVEALPRMLTGLLSAVIRDSGVDSMDVLFNLGVLLMSDALHTLQELGIAEMEEADANQVIASTVESVMKENPEFAKKVMADPRTAEMMKGAGGAMPPPTEGGVMPPPTTPSPPPPSPIGGMM